ncbi:MAG: hypothetical protein IJD78_04235 [Clostridia bacterium]|nr:hypothetical protein [Clostridia bacterium]
MPYTATDFNLAKNQKAERKLLVTCVNIGDSITKADGTPKWVPIGAGVTESAVEYNPETEKSTDIFGITETSVKKLEPSQSLDPMTIRGGNPVLFKLCDILERNALSELSLFEVMLIRAYIKEGEADAEGGYHAEVHKNCTITPQSEGGSGTVDMPVTVDYSNDKVLGTVNAYKHDADITFTPNAA